MRNYVTEVMNGTDLAETFAELSNEIRKGGHNNNYISELKEQETTIKSFMAFEYMKEHGYSIQDNHWKK